MGKRYRMFLLGEQFEKINETEGKVLSQVVLDMDTQEHFEAKVVLSSSPKEGYDEVVIASERGTLKPGQWYLKVLEREEAEEEKVTVFESMRLGERKGYMLRSMMAEEKAKLKKETMSTELEKRLKRKQEIVKKLLERG